VQEGARSNAEVDPRILLGKRKRKVPKTCGKLSSTEQNIEGTKKRRSKLWYRVEKVNISGEKKEHLKANREEQYRDRANLF